jgi:hypothetical protein
LTLNEDVVAATLRRGRNELILKITQGGGDWGGACRVRTREGFRLDGLETSPMIGKGADDLP